MRSIRIGTVAVAFVGLSALAACSSSSKPASAPSHSSSGGPRPASASGTSSAPRQIEVNPPGDIPDNQAFVPYQGTGFSVTVPEGWAQSSNPAGITFADKYNNIVISTAATATAPTAASARSNELPAIQAAAQGFAPGQITMVQRTAGTAILITYRALSAVNPVTGKVVNESVERYEFWRSGREVVLTLAAPVGSDNVDPWLKVTNSFRWTGK